jgi:hypothetical protein
VVVTGVIVSASAGSGAMMPAVLRAATMSFTFVFILKLPTVENRNGIQRS